MTEVVVDRIRLRGDASARLARVAARALPAALERALGDVGDAEVGSLAVPLDPEVLTLDDEAIAAVWADAIRAALIAEGVPTGRRRDDAEPGRTPATATGANPGPTGAVERDRVTAWLDSASPRGPVPVGALLLARRASTPSAPSGPEHRRDIELGVRVRAALGEELRLRHRREGGAPAPGPGPASAPPSPAVAIEPAGAGAPPADAAPARGDRTGSARAARPDRPDDLAATAEALADLAHGRRGDELVDLDGFTRAAGLALLYPWLADHCRAAVEARPGEHPASVRGAALAALIEPDDPDLLDDVLIRHLAGARAGDAALSPPRWDTAEVTDAADRVLRSFAALLPGFGESTPGFVRREWVERPGLLDVGRDPALLLAQARPLDVVLTALPYPVGLFALPWCRPVTVRFRP